MRAVVSSASQRSEKSEVEALTHKRATARTEVRAVAQS